MRLATPPRRIVSLVPSTTETLFALGLGDRVVGVTRFCVHPAEALRGLPRVGGTKDLDLDRLDALHPDLVIGNAEENTREIFDAVEARCPLYVAFPRTVDEALDDLSTTGRLVGASAQAEALRSTIEARRAALAARVAGRRFTYAYLIWRGPWMAVSGDTFIAAMLAEAGGVNAFAERQPRYFTLAPAELVGVDRVLLSSEPFPFKPRHAAELAEAGVDPGRVAFVDGELCSWHGARMARAFPYLGTLTPPPPAGSGPPPGP
ncbi:MAG: ABC transporter substrate-binding protein [Alphaproteobacteria bacterium]|nr:ABC transporter substrate-binding protein [Alphaproteobacteria bacterium]